MIGLAFWAGNRKLPSPVPGVVHATTVYAMYRNKIFCCCLKNAGSLQVPAYKLFKFETNF